MKWIKSRRDIAKNSLAIFVVLLVSVLGVRLLMGSHAATGATLSLTSTASSIKAGDTVSVTVHEDSGSDVVNSVQASLNYDAAQLQYVSMTEGTAFPTIAANSTATAGVIRVGRATTGTPVSGSNAVVTVNFKVLTASASAAISFDKNFSFVVRSSDNVDVLGTTSSLTLAPTTSTTNSASMSLSPGVGSATVGSTFTVAVHENSGSANVNSVQSSVMFDSTKLQYISLTEGGSFTSLTATDTATAGRVRVARSVQSGSAGVSGDTTIVTLTFKVLTNSSPAAVTLDKTQSFVVDASSNTDILTTVADSSFTITGSPAASSAMFSLSPTTGTYAQGSTLSVVVKASSAAALTTVEAAINYPASQLQYVSTTEGGVFTTAQRTNATASGLVDIIRSLPGGNAGVSGTNPVVTLNFKVIGNNGSAAVTYSTTAAAFDDSGTGTNILDRAGSTTAIYTLNPTATPPPQVPASGKAILSLSPSSGTYESGATVSITVKTTSTTAALTTIEPVLSYPASQLQYVSTTEGGVFTTAQRTNTSTAGVIDLIRSLPGGSAGVTGTNSVVTLNFKVIGTSGNIGLQYGKGTAVFDDTGSGANIIDVTGTTGATFSISTAPATCSANPGTPGAPTRTSSNYTTITLTWVASAPGAECTLAGYHIFRSGVPVGDVTSGSSFTDSGLSAGVAYTYTAQAFDTTGHASAVSAPANLITKIDDMAPTTPSGVTAAAPNASSVDLAWNPSTDFPNPGGAGIKGYHIYRSNSTAATYSVTNSTTFTDSNVSASTTYSYTLRAYDNLGNESAPSNIVSAKTAAAQPSCSGTPSVPASLTAGAPTITSVRLSWTASSASSGCTLAGYRIYRGATIVGTSLTPSFENSGLLANTSYTYSVQAYDTSGHASAQSSAKTTTTARDTVAPSAPASVTATAVSAGRVNLAWTASNDNLAVTGYKIYRNGTLLLPVTSPNLSYSDTQVAGDTNYNYTVSAVDSAGNESAQTISSPNPVHTPAAPDTQAPSSPSNLQTVAVTSTDAVITWNASTDNTAVTGYHVYRGSTYVGDTAELSYKIDGLTAGTSYDFTVKAFDASGNSSPASNVLTIMTLIPDPSLIGDLNGDNSIDVFDLSIMMSHWQEVDVPVKFGDIDQDGVVNQFDLDILLANLGDQL